MERRLGGTAVPAQAAGPEPLGCGRHGPHHHAGVPATTWRRAVGVALLRGGQRLTEPRGVVLDWIAGAEVPFTPEGLVADLPGGPAGGSRATAYRLLDWLRSGGWVGRVRLEAGYPAYCRTLPGHHQAVCLGCGMTLLIGGCDIAASLAPTLTGAGFVIEEYGLELYGRCADCRAEADAWARNGGGRVPEADSRRRQREGAAAP